MTTVQIVGAVLVGASVLGVALYGVRRFFLELLAGTGAEFDVPLTRQPIRDYDEDDHGLSWRMRTR